MVMVQPAITAQVSGEQVIELSVHMPSMQFGDSKTAMATLSLAYLSMNVNMVPPMRLSSLLSLESNWVLGELI